LTRADYVAMHTTGFIIALLAPLVIWLLPKKPVAFIFFAFVFTPVVFFNMRFLCPK
jgi:hypothetical protein